MKLLYIFSKILSNFLKRNSTKKKSNIVKNQHYIPRAFLKYFVTQNATFFEALVESKKVYPSSPNSSMSESFTYEHEKLEVNTLEKFFSNIENKAVPKMKNVIELIDRHKNGKNEFHEIRSCIKDILPLLILFYYRSGALLTEFSSLDKDSKILLLNKKIMNPHYIRELAGAINSVYKFAIIESDENFLMSDQYLSTAALKIKGRFWDRSNRHMGLIETIILIPITNCYYGVYWHTNNDFFIKESQINKLCEPEIKLVNQTIINNSYIKCIGGKKEKISEVLDNFNLERPSQIFAGGNPPGFHMGAIKKKEVFFYKQDEDAFDFLKFLNFENYRGLGRNDPCACKSGKKFKNCHETAFKIIEPVVRRFGNKDKSYVIPGIKIIELPVDQWAGYSKK